MATYSTCKSVVVSALAVGAMLAASVPSHGQGAAQQRRTAAPSAAQLNTVKRDAGPKRPAGFRSGQVRDHRKKNCVQIGAAGPLQMGVTPPPICN